MFAFSRVKLRKYREDDFQAIDLKHGISSVELRIIEQKLQSHIFQRGREDHLAIKFNHNSCAKVPLFICPFSSFHVPRHHFYMPFL
jgi:hypothetical protein